MSLLDSLNNNSGILTLGSIIVPIIAGLIMWFYSIRLDIQKLKDRDDLQQKQIDGIILDTKEINKNLSEINSTLASLKTSVDFIVDYFKNQFSK
jgi:hypothetical protein